MDKFILKREEAVLVVVDIQERLAAVMKKREKVETNTGHLLEAAKLLGVPVIVTEQYSKGLGATTKEVQACLAEYRPYEKMTFSCCEQPDFMEAVKETGRKKVILVGMETHVCVLQTCVGLLATGHDVHLVQDAVCSRYKDNYEIGVEYMRQAGAVVTSTETVLFQLLYEAGTDAFKSIVKRIK